MDNGKKSGRWDWLPAAMPGVARQMAEHRRKMGEAHVRECWRRGVLQLEPGWFFAREGPLTVGTPWGDAEMANFAALSVSATQSLVIIRPVEAAHGSD